MQSFQQETPNGHITYHYKSQISQTNQSSKNSSEEQKPNNQKTIYDTDIFQFTTQCFPKSLKQYDKADIPYGVFIKPFSSKIQVFIKENYFRI